MIDVAPEDLVACICEGSAEKTIIEILLNNDKLRFTKKQLLSGAILTKKYRNSVSFQNDFLTLDYEERKIVIIVVQDREIGYKIRDPYSGKIKGNYSLLTRPEIEMLMIHSLRLRDEFGKVKRKPSVFLQNKLRIREPTLKSKEYIENFYNNHDLVSAIIEHKRVTKDVSGHYFLADILK